MDRIEGTLEAEHAGRVRWKRAFWAVAVALLLVAGVAVAIAATQHSFQGVQGDVYAYDTSKFALTSDGMDVPALPAVASGTTSGTAVEMGVANANTAISVGHWFYQVTVAEAALTSGATIYKAELFLDGVSKGALYFVDLVDLPAESVVLKWSLGADMPSNGAYVVKITTA
jgi:hypothetical protein